MKENEEEEGGGHLSFGKMKKVCAPSFRQKEGKIFSAWTCSACSDTSINKYLNSCTKYQLCSDMLSCCLCCRVWGCVFEHLFEHALCVCSSLRSGPYCYSTSHKTRGRLAAPSRVPYARCRAGAVVSRRSASRAAWRMLCASCVTTAAERRARWCGRYACGDARPRP